jgi:hypothetical protein
LSRKEKSSPVVSLVESHHPDYESDFELDKEETVLVSPNFRLTDFMLGWRGG